MISFVSSESSRLAIEPLQQGQLLQYIRLEFRHCSADHRQMWLAYLKVFTVLELNIFVNGILFVVSYIRRSTVLQIQAANLLYSVIDTYKLQWEQVTVEFA